MEAVAGSAAWVAEAAVPVSSQAVAAVAGAIADERVSTKASDSSRHVACWLSLEQCLRKLLRVERLQVVRLLPEADKLDGQAKLLLNGYDHPAFASAVELRDH